MASKRGPKPGPTSVLQARYAVLSRDRDPDDPELIEARRAFIFARDTGRIAQIVADLPPMTPAQRQKIANMLKAGAS